MNILVTGGAGYVGSHSVRELLDAKHRVTVLDTLEKGHLRACRGAEFVMGDTADTELTTAILEQRQIECVMHFAASMEVGESMTSPEKYYANNTAATARLLRSCINKGVKKFIFSSTCAIYGTPESLPLVEDTPKHPESVYGHTKLQTEEMLAWMSRQTDFRYVALRYFNACGAHASGDIGEAHNPESHLIPLTLQVAQGTREAIKIFGTDYPTADGTCIRDYVHVSDLARAHIAAMHYLGDGGESSAFNVGTGNGYSVREIIDTCRAVTGHAIPAIEEPRRAGDPAALYANPDKIRSVLGWKPVESDLDTIIQSAWKWHKANPNGYVRPERS